MQWVVYSCLYVRATAADLEEKAASFFSSLLPGAPALKLHVPCRKM